jgi:tetratricopeptide (TPR) repeat protein
LIATSLLVLPAAADGQDQHGHAPAAKPETAMLLEGMGEAHHPIWTSNPEAQKFFDQGLALIYGFNREEALRSFRRAAQLDPKAPMPQWGIALGLGPHINMDGDGDYLPKEGNEAIQKAVALSASAPEQERALIAAMSTRFSIDPKAGEKQLSIAYRQAMAAFVRNYPDDLDAKTLYAESIMCLSRWDYWEPDGKPKRDTDEFVAVLEEVLRREPHHIGANHYYIHAVEASPTPERALPSAARLMGLAPLAGHLVHMPGHIFLRTGDFEQAAFTNERAVRADQEYIKQAKVAPGVYSMGYASHNIHFIVFARSMSGRFADARKAADELAAHVAPGLTIMPPMVDYFGVNSLLVLYRFNRWDDILKVAEPNAKLPVTAALWRFARCTAFARKGQTADAQSERKAFDAATAKVPSDYMLTFNPAGNVLKVAAAILDARLSADDASAVTHWRRAVAAQDALHYDEPPPWFYPVRESLGAALLRSGKPVEAEAVFREDLRLNPRNGRSLFGLMKALEAQNKTAEAAWVQREFDRAWKFADTQLKIEDY